MGYVNDILEFMGHPWVDLGMALVIFGLAPDLLLRLLVLIYPRNSDRRKELIAELRVVPRWERPFWVAEQITLIMSEGSAARLRVRERERMMRAMEQALGGKIIVIDGESRELLDLVLSGDFDTGPVERGVDGYGHSYREVFLSNPDASRNVRIRLVSAPPGRHRR